MLGCLAQRTLLRMKLLRLFVCCQTDACVVVVVDGDVVDGVADVVVVDVVDGVCGKIVRKC